MDLAASFFSRAFIPPVWPGLVSVWFFVSEVWENSLVIFAENIF